MSWLAISGLHAVNGSRLGLMACVGPKVTGALLEHMARR